MRNVTNFIRKYINKTFKNQFPPTISTLVLLISIRVFIPYLCEENVQSFCRKHFFENKRIIQNSKENISEQLTIIVFIDESHHSRVYTAFDRQNHNLDMYMDSGGLFQYIN